MITIPVTDKFGLTTDLQLEPKDGALPFGLHALESKVSEFATAAEKPLDGTDFRSALFGGLFTSPQMNLNAELTLCVKTGANVALQVYRNADETLFKGGSASPDIPIERTQSWVELTIDTTLAFQLGAVIPSGFGVCGKSIQARSVSSYSLVESKDGQFPTLKASVEAALSGFGLLRNAADARKLDLNRVSEWDVSGSFELDGTYTYPLALNSYTLAKVALPFNHVLGISPAVDLSLTGALTVLGEFRGRCYRTGSSKIQLGLYKKKESDLSASFQEAAGVIAGTGSTDMIGKLFSVLPGVDLTSLQISDADRDAMKTALKGAVDQGLSVALNGMCSASWSDEVAVLYEIDLTVEDQATDDAINAALKGNWTPLSKLPNARVLRNVLTETHKSGLKASVNLLGIYDAASGQDFVRECCILHNMEDGAVTITDKATAQRIAISAKPFVSQDDKLRKVLDQAFLATVAYTAAASQPGLKTDIEAEQSLLVYSARSSYAALRKSLLLGVSLQLISAADLEKITIQREFQYVRLAARATFQGDDALRLFFSDIQTRTGYREEDLKRLGRQVLASLLDRNDTADNLRRQILNNDAAWAEMDNQKFPPGSPASYSDWVDITTWAHAIAAVAPRLKSVLEAADNLKGADPAKDSQFMAQRTALSKTLLEATRDTRAAFEKGWPIAVTFALTGRKAPVSFTAQWNGTKYFDAETAKALTA